MKLSGLFFTQMRVD